jgi:hypothetical protein
VQEQSFLPDWFKEKISDTGKNVLKLERLSVAVKVIEFS